MVGSIDLALVEKIQNLWRKIDMPKNTGDNPYLQPGRLPDVIAAITALGNYRYYKLSFEACAERIGNDPTQSNKWKVVLGEHPEFFRVSERQASLVWRRQFLKNYDPKSNSQIERKDFEALTSNQKGAYSRRPLTSNELATLIETAVSLHQRALEHQVAGRFWIPIVTAILAFGGALIGAWMAS